MHNYVIRMEFDSDNQIPPLSEEHRKKIALAMTDAIDTILNEVIGDDRAMAVSTWNISLYEEVQTEQYGIVESPVLTPEEIAKLHTEAYADQLGLENR